MASLFGLQFDPTPGNLGINQAWNNFTRAGNSITGAGGSQVRVTNPTGAKPVATQPNVLQTRNSDSMAVVDTPVVQSAFTAAQQQAAANAAATQQANNQAIGIANSAIGRLPNQLNIARDNINRMYGTQQNELNSTRAQSENMYNQSTTQNQQDRLNNNNQIDQQASSGLRGLLRILGQRGAGGSSAAQLAAPDAVGNLASQQRSGAAQTFGQNQQALDTNWNNFQTGWDNSNKKLEDWKNQEWNNAEAQSLTSKQSLLQTLAGLQNSPGAAQPYIDQVNSLAGQVDNLGRINPTYNGETPVYDAPDVSTYAVQGGATPTLQGGGGQATSSPWLSMLLGQQRERQRQLF